MSPVAAATQPHTSIGAGNAEQHIPDKEDAGAEAKDRIGKTELASHLQPGEADVDPVDIGDDVQEEQKRHQASRDMTPGAFGEIDADRSRMSHAEKHITCASR